MWFKQIQLFQLPSSISCSSEDLTDQLESLTFKLCLPSMPFSMGWTSVLNEEDAPLIQCMNNCMMLCLQIEEKILPATVIRQELVEKIKQIEVSENRKVQQKEKYTLKDEIILSLLPRAFSKLTRIYAYIDTKHHWLVLGSANEKRTEQFLSMFRKTIDDQINFLELKKLSPIMTHWLKHKNCLSSFAVEKICMLQDPNQQTRIVRCYQQDLFANSIQSLINDGYEVKEIALSWQNQVHFILADDFSLHSVQFQDEIREQAENMC